MQITARADYAIRALAELTARGGASATRAELAEAQSIPSKFLEAILADLKKAGLVVALRGSGGGYLLAQDAEAITIADIVRAVDGPLAAVRGLAPEALQYSGSTAALRDLWVAVRASLRDVLESETLADVVSGELPSEVTSLQQGDDVYKRR